MPATVLQSAEIAIPALFQTDAIALGTGETLRIHAYSPWVSGFHAFAPASNEGLRLYVRVLDLRDAFVGEYKASEFYPALKLKKRRNTRQRGRLTKGFSDITWNQLFAFPILSLADDVFQIKFKRKVPVGFDEIIVVGTEPVRNLPRGDIQEVHLKSPNGSARVLVHLAAPGQAPFAPGSFTAHQLNVRAIEAWDLGSPGSIAKSDPYLRMRISGDQEWRKTAAKQDTTTPQWYSDFTFLVTDPVKNSFVVDLMDDNTARDTVMGSVVIPISGLTTGVTTSQVYEFDPNRAKVRLLLQLTPEGSVRFEDLQEADERVVYDDLALHLRIAEGRGLPAMDTSGGCDPYCLVQFEGSKERSKTRTIINSRNPVWNDVFHFRIRSLETDVLCVSVFDFDVTTGDDFVGMVRLELSRLQFGEVIDGWYTLDGSKGEVRLVSHISGPGMPSWVPQIFLPKRLQFNVFSNDLGSDHRYLRIRLAQDWFPHFSLMGRSVSEDFGFLLTDPASDILEITICEHSVKAADTDCASFKIPIAEFCGQGPHEVTCDSGLRVRGFVTETIPTVQLQFSAGENCRCALHILDAKDFPCVCGSYVKCKFVKRKQSVLSRIAWPLRSWNSVVMLDAVSGNGEQLKFTLMRHCPAKKDKKLGKGLFSVTDAGFGVVVDTELSIRSYPRKIIEKVVKKPWTATMRVRVQLVAALAIPFVQWPFIPQRLRVIVVEAVNVPSMDTASQPDPYCRLKLANDVSWKSTSVINDSWTPQWCEAFDFWILDDCQSDVTLNVTLMEKNVKWDQQIGQSTVALGQLQPGMVVKGWYAVPGVSDKVKLNLVVHLVGPDGLAIDASLAVLDPIPPGIVLPKH
jgi:hypothetical protein